MSPSSESRSAHSFSAACSSSLNSIDTGSRSKPRDSPLQTRLYTQALQASHLPTFNSVHHNERLRGRRVLDPSAFFFAS